MTGTPDNTSSVSSSQPAVNNVSAGAPVDDATYQQMLNILKDLTNHTHTFYDDYGTNCQCNCACFSGNTRVCTKHGNIPIADLVGKSSEVLCHDGVWRIAECRSFGIQKLVLIQFEDLSNAETTANHRWKVIGENEPEITENMVGKSIPVLGRDGGTIQLKVISVTPLLDSEGNQREEEVFCFVEPVTETFVLAGGIVTMNCNCTCCTRGMVW